MSTRMVPRWLALLAVATLGLALSLSATAQEPAALAVGPGNVETALVEQLLALDDGSQQQSWALADSRSIVPIWSDSTSMIEAQSPRKRAKVAAAIQPAVPPPAITISRGGGWSIQSGFGGGQATPQGRLATAQITNRARAPEPVGAAAVGEPGTNPLPGSPSHPRRSGLPGAAQVAAAVGVEAAVAEALRDGHQT